jgi:uncharacterized membrane protein
LNPGEAVDKVGDVIADAGQKAGEIANATKDLDNIAINILLSAFDNLLPKEPSNNKFEKITIPIVTSTVLNILVLLILITFNEKNLICSIIGFLLLFVSFLLNLCFFIITLLFFSIVFNVIGAIPGIGDNRTGSAIYLSSLSTLFLFTALIIMKGGNCRFFDFNIR